MSPFEKLFYQRLMRRVANLEPELARALLRAFEILRDEMPESEFARLIAGGDVDAVVNHFDKRLLDRAFAEFRDKLYDQNVRGVKYFAADIARAIGKPTLPTQQVGIQFNRLNPRMLTAVLDLETKVMAQLTADVRVTVRQAVERGLKAGANPRTTARDLKNVIGLGASQDQEVENLRKALIDKNYARVKSYKLFDKRYLSRVKKGNYGPDEIELWTDKYRQRRIDLNAETVARTATLDAQKLAQRNSWESAIERGIVNRAELNKRWAGTLDSRERPKHVEMEGETVGFDEEFSNKQMIPGDTEYNCRCIAVYGTRLKKQEARTVAKGRDALARERQLRQMTDEEREAAEKKAAPQTNSLLDFEEQIAAEPIEHALAVAEDGTVVLKKTGGRSSVSFSDAEVALLANTRMTHNHPRGSWGFSWEDINFAMTANLTEIRAVTRDQVSSMLRPDGGWSVSRLTVKRAFNVAKFESEDELGKLYRAKSITDDQYSQRYFFEVWTRVAQKFGWAFSSTPR